MIGNGISPAVICDAGQHAPVVDYVGAVAFAGFLTVIGAHPNPRAVFTSGLVISSGLIAGVLAGLIFCLIAEVPWRMKS